MHLPVSAFLQVPRVHAMSVKKYPWHGPAAQEGRPSWPRLDNRKLTSIVALLKEGRELDGEQAALAIQVLAKFIDPATGCDTISFAGRGRPKNDRKATDDACLVQEIDWRIAEAKEAGSKRARTEIFEQVANEKGIEVETLNKVYRLAIKQAAEDDKAFALRLKPASENIDDFLELLAYREECPAGLLKRRYERGTRLLQKDDEQERQ